MKRNLAIRELHRSERKLAVKLDAIGARHRTDHEVYFITRDLARWSADHIKELARAGRRYGLNLKEQPRTNALTERLQQELSTLVGRRPEPGLVLLLDLRHLHRIAAGVSVDWELLAQGAQDAKDTELLALAKRCHPESPRQMRWANAMLKTLSPQILAS